MLNCQKYNFVVHISELIRREALQEGQPNKYCRVMAYNETHGMLVVSQVRETDIWNKLAIFYLDGKIVQILNFTIGYQFGTFGWAYDNPNSDVSV